MNPTASDGAPDVSPTAAVGVFVQNPATDVATAAMLSWIHWKKSPMAAPTGFATAAAADVIGVLPLKHASALAGVGGFIAHGSSPLPQIGGSAATYAANAVFT